MTSGMDIREYRLLDLPGYMAWSEEKLAAGESQALIAHLDATSASLSPSELAEVSSALFDELLDELKQRLG